MRNAYTIIGEKKYSNKALGIEVDNKTRNTIKSVKDKKYKLNVINLFDLKSGRSNGMKYFIQFLFWEW